MFWNGNNLQPPVSPGIRRKNLHWNYRLFFSKIVSCLLAEIISQAEGDGFLPCIPRHNNHSSERQQNLTTDPQLEWKQHLDPSFNFVSSSKLFPKSSKASFTRSPVVQWTSKSSNMLRKPLSSVSLVQLHFWVPRARHSPGSCLFSSLGNSAAAHNLLSVVLLAVFVPYQHSNQPRASTYSSWT